MAKSEKATKCSREEIDRASGWFHARTIPSPEELAAWLQVWPKEADRKKILTESAWFTVDLARVVYTGAKPQHLRALLYNRNLKRVVVRALGEWLTRDWEALARGKSANLQNPLSYLADLMDRNPEVSWAAPVRRVYASAQELSDTLKKLKTGSRQSRSCASKRTFKDALGVLLLSYVSDFSKAIIYWQLRVPSDVLCASLSFVPKTKAVLRDFVRHPDADASALRAVVQISNDPFVLEFVARNDELRWDFEIRPILLQSKNPFVLTELLQDAEPEVAAEIVRYLLREDKVEYIGIGLDFRDPKLPIALEPHELTPLLQNADHRIRLTGITWLGRLSLATRAAVSSDCVPNVEPKRSKG